MRGVRYAPVLASTGAVTQKHTFCRHNTLIWASDRSAVANKRILSTLGSALLLAYCRPLLLSTMKRKMRVWNISVGVCGS